jgi:lysine-ketoglutarate reductase/saccharopine dehydrogenase-like protein (TIGR00300 family)
MKEIFQKRGLLMSFKLPQYQHPDFLQEPFISAPDAKVACVAVPGVAPENFHATTIFPEYIKIKGKWILAQESRMDCVLVLNAAGGLEVKEFRRLISGDQVITGRSEDGSEGIFVYPFGFTQTEDAAQTFAFRTGRTRETSYSRDYDKLYELLKYEKENGYIVWVLGPAVTFDHDSRGALISLIENGYVHAVLAGNALATHDMEGAILRTALGQDIYTQESLPNGHYHHLDVINQARQTGSLENMVMNGHLQNGIVFTCIQKGIPLVLCGSIRDDGPLPGVIPDVYLAQNAMREHLRKATTVIGLATQLHTIASGNMTPAYQVAGNQVRPVYFYCIDISEFAVNKLRDRGSLSVTSIVTNIQDFLVNLMRNTI